MSVTFGFPVALRCLLGVAALCKVEYPEIEGNNVLGHILERQLALCK